MSGDPIEAQANLTAIRERMLYAAAHKHFKIFRCTPRKNPPMCINAPDVPTLCSIRSEDAVVDETAELALADFEANTVIYGDWLVIDWSDPRPDSNVWEATAPRPNGGRSAPFAFWDGPSLALEHYVNAIGSQDAEKRKFLGNWLYIADDRAAPHLFWSMVIHYHTTTRCFPPIPTAFLPDLQEGAGPTPSTPKDCAIAIYNREMDRILKVLSEAADTNPTFRGQEMRVASELESVSASMQGLMASQNPTKVGVPNPPTMVATYLQMPRWVGALEALWGGLFKRYIDGGPTKAPCMWVNKVGRGLVGCLAGQKCRAEHGPVEKAVTVVKQVIKLPRSEQDRPELNIDSTPSDKFVQNAVFCYNPVCTVVKPKEKMSRCSRCKNPAYCSVECQKSDWKEHKKNCRAPGSDAAAGKQWAVLFPGDESKRPCPVLLPTKDWQLDVQELLDTQNMVVKPVARGENIGYVAMIVAMEGERSNPKPFINRPANSRASAIVTQLTPENPSGRYRRDGVYAPVRGDAVCVRFAPPTAGASNAAPELRDFGYQDYDHRWGTFMMIQIPSESKSKTAEDGEWVTSALFPNTPEGNSALKNVLNLGKLPQ